MDTQAIKITLETRQQALLQRIEAISTDLQKSHSADFAEQVTERENDEVLQALLEESRKELQHTNAALQRIDNGEYGHCITCGKAISAQRLAVLPETNSCIQCAA